VIRLNIKETGFAPVARFNVELPERIRQTAVLVLRRGMEAAVTKSQLEYFHEGTSVLPDRLRAITGRLRKSITSKVDTTARGAIGRIGTNVKYGAYHEFGFNGTVQVREHLRARSVVNANFQESDPRRSWKRNGTVLAWKENLIQAAARTGGFVSGIQRVKAHARKVAYKGRPFLRPALEAVMPLILTDLETKLQEISNG
jgi:phage gpG-like protein